VLGKLEDIKEVVALEISPAVIAGLNSIHTNFDFKFNSKVKVIERDAFRYFSKTDKTFDLIVSEPSNPWVMGVENLFAREFYQLAKKKLNKGGVLVQWLHTYSMDTGIFRMVCHTLKQEFKYVEVYLIGYKDIVMLASQTPFHYGETLKNRFSNSVLAPLHRSFGLLDPKDLRLIQILDSDRFAKSHFQESGFHSLTVPKLTYKADKAFFLGTEFEVFDIFSGPLPLPSQKEETRVKRFKKYLKIREKVTKRCLRQGTGFTFFCNYMSRSFNAYDAYKNQANSVAGRFQIYQQLRNLGLIEYDKKIIKEVKKWIIHEKVKSFPNLLAYIHQTFSMKGSAGIQEDISEFQLEDPVRKKLTGYIEKIKQSPNK
ncbi:MAG: hypothetical protein OXB86_00690, partial [Bdellovibrionales bacterium]|nr:hypothetical protein [Bdellovibrionales bacterium]